MTNSSSSTVHGAKALDVGHELREIGHLAVWTVTSAKPGNGVELLRDGNKDTYWQSDGTQPHLVDIQFQKKMHIKVGCHNVGTLARLACRNACDLVQTETCFQELALYLDYRLDESYTPKLISIRAGNSFTDMVEVHTQELEEPHGWTRIPLETQNSLQGASFSHVEYHFVYQPVCKGCFGLSHTYQPPELGHDEVEEKRL
jgi:hypothetical protein